MINIKDIKQNIFSLKGEYFDCEDEPEYFVMDNGLTANNEFYAGMKEPPIKPSRFFDMDSLVEHMHESAYCEYNEGAEDYLFDLDENVKNELGNKISELLDKHLPEPGFCHIIDIVAYRIVKIDGDDIFVELSEDNNS